MSAPPGRRERKKQLTRQAISDVATSLFMDRGFDAVTVADIAAATDVAVQTVFNHFPTKEDLFFDNTRWVDGPAAAVRAAPAGTVAAEVLRAYYRSVLDDLQGRGHLPSVAQFIRTIGASSALRARRARMADEMQERLAAALSGGDPDWRDRLVAAQFAAVYQVLEAELVRRLDAEPDDPNGVLAGMSPVLDEAFAVLDR